MTTSDQRSPNVFEQEARDERAYYDGLSIEDLHTLIQNREFGRTGMLWQSLRQRTTLLASGWIVLDILDRRSVNRAARAEAAGVLLQLADSHDWSAEALTDDTDPEFENRLREVRRMVNQRIRSMT